MEIDEYLHAQEATLAYPGRKRFWGLTYLSLKLNGEAGEVAEKVGKAMRDDEVGPDKEAIKTPSAWRLALAKELGDILWYVFRLIIELGFTPQQVLQMNIDKLNDRKARGVLGGSGDDR